MVNKEAKQRMADFVLARLEQSGCYNVLKSNLERLLLEQKPDIDAQKKTIHLILHNQPMTESEYFDILNSNFSKGIFTSSILYNDGKTFFKPLGRSAHARKYKSLKQYSDKQRDNMIGINLLAFNVLQFQENRQFLVYFQPDPQRREESIRAFNILPIDYDRTHIKEGHKSYGFCRIFEQSKFEKIADECYQITDGPAMFSPASKFHKTFVIMPVPGYNIPVQKKVS
ncbi:MAG: hypothetical protein V1837_05625 [Candidatus Woesearchaeota archaeon]